MSEERKTIKIGEEYYIQMVNKMVEKIDKISALESEVDMLRADLVHLDSQLDDERAENDMLRHLLREK